MDNRPACARRPVRTHPPVAPWPLVTVLDTPAVPHPPAGPTGWSLTPGTRLLWRGDGSFELERGARGVVVAGLDRAVAMSLARRPVTPSAASLAADRQAEVPVTLATEAADVDALVRLRELGYVRAHLRAGPARDEAPGGQGATPDPGEPLDRRAAEGDRSEGDRADVNPAAHVPDGRRGAVVVVQGGTRVAAYLGALLAASGVGRVSFTSMNPVRRRDLLPGGLGPADEGRRFAEAAAGAVRRAAPATDVTPLASGAEPDLVVLCSDAPVEPELRDLLHRRRRAHLPVHLDAVRAEIGPLVVPGVSACLRCADLHRLDQDPAWTMLAVQLLTGAAVAPPAEPGLAARAAGFAAGAALSYLDGPPDDGLLTGSWEVRPGWAVPRRRHRLPHPECDCRAAWTPTATWTTPTGGVGADEARTGRAE